MSKMDDKKKLMVVGALAVVIIAVGAFQIMSSGSTPAPTPAKPKESTTADQKPLGENPTGSGAEYNADGSPVGEEAVADASTDPLKHLYSMNLSARDPFDSIGSLPTPIEASRPKPTPQPPRPRNYTPPSVPPFNPLGGTLPPLGGSSISVPDGSLPTLSAPQPPPGPAYSVSGVIRGEKNAAVISDAQGNQRLVREGQAIDGDAKVVSVGKGKVVIRKQDGKTITLRVGGNP